MRLLYVIILLAFQTVVAQKHINGQVFDRDTKEPLPSVFVVNPETNDWAITDETGTFQLRMPNTKEVSITFRLLGKQEATLNYKKENLNTKIVVFLQKQDLRLDEVVVTARKGKKFSEITIGREVIEQVQAFSLNEVLEQLPGQAITNFTLNEFKPIAFRTVRPSTAANTGFGNKSFGTAIVVDGIPISNNENMQSYGGNYGPPFSPNFLGFGDPSSSSGFNGYFSNANYGADLREIPVDNIEKVEVVQGVPSAKYGDLTSGLIKIEQKAGKSPYRVYTSLRDGTTEYGFAKGFKVNDKIGFVNLTVNYLKSNAEPRVSYTEYERITTNLMWSWSSKSKNIRNSFSVDYGFNNDNVNYEEEDTDNKIVKNKKKDLSVSNRFKWKFSENSFFDNLDINANFRYSDQLTYESKFVNIGGSIVGTSTEEGVYSGTYTLPSYTSVKAVEGIPISSFASADLYKTFNTGDWSHSLLFGTSFRTSDNKGRGRLGSPETMISAFASTNGGSGQGFRPYNYGENIRAEYQFSLYAEDNITRNWENSTFYMNTGVRLDNQFGFTTLAPRINSYYQYDKFKIRGGFGITSKAPSLNQIYTGPRYYDAVLGDYRYPGYYNLGIVQTFIDYPNNKDLKPTKSMRTELGFDYKLPFGNLNFTGFYNKMYDGITNEGIPSVRDMAVLDIQFNGTQTPTYQVTGYTPFYYLQSRLVNKFESKDRGLEFFMSFEKTPFKNITFDIQGSYIETVNTDTRDSFERIASTTPRLEKMAVLKPYDENSKSFRLGANVNYHLPKVGLIIAVRSEHFIIDNTNYRSGNRLYAYIDENLNKIIIPEAERDTHPLLPLLAQNNALIDRSLQKVYHNFHLRVSKDFKNGFRFSFYSNNFLDLKQTEDVIDNGVQTKRPKSGMVQLSFGTKIEYQF
ncbi:TonB-dependent receptor [Flavobacterium sp. WV_118_3]|uniref:TonB-dependent receptor n=1 Tax=Flavobacterium sp. WV_118_3 TaxID=3151764 RepID=UPI00321A9890